MLCATLRPMMSVPPPRGVGTIRRNGRAGNSWALAGERATSPTSRQPNTARRRIGPPGRFSARILQSCRREEMMGSVAFSHTGVFVHDLNRMVEFYTRFLGLVVSDRDIARN